MIEPAARDDARAATLAANASSRDAMVRRNLRVLFAAQVMFGTAFAVTASLGSIVAAQLTGSDSLAGVPSTLNFFASAVAAYLIARLMAARGRRAGLTTGFALGAVGAALAGTMALRGSFPGFLAGSAMIGAAQGIVQQGRYAAAEMVAVGARGRVVGALLTGSVLGSFVSSAIAPLVQGVATRLNVPAVDLGWFLGAIVLACGAVVLAVALRPDPRDLAVDDAPAESAPGEARAFTALLADARVRLALTATALGQGTMVTLMVLTPLHARHLGHDLPTITLLVTGHVFGMYGFAWLTGRVADAWGRERTILAGAVVLAAASVLAILGERLFEIGASLFLLGLGWNLCYVAGSALLSDRLHAAERARTQGTAEVVVWLTAAAGAMGGGLLVGAYGFTSVGWAGLAAAVAVAVACLAWGRDAARRA